MSTLLSSGLKDLLHLFFPHVCEGCGSDVLDKDALLCAACFEKLPVTGFIEAKDNPVEKIFYGRLSFEEAASAFYFNKNSLLRHLMVQLKYRGNKQIGFYLGALTGDILLKSGRFNEVDVMVPLPLNSLKELKRGYNQTALIAGGIASVWKKPVLKESVERPVFTETQTHKNRVSRWQTMQDAFKISDENSLKGKHVLLLDDIVTTGASLEACGEKILKVPGTKLSLLTVALTV